MAIVNSRWELGLALDRHPEAQLHQFLEALSKIRHAAETAMESMREAGSNRFKIRMEIIDLDERRDEHKRSGENMPAAYDRATARDYTQMAAYYGRGGGKTEAMRTAANWWAQSVAAPSMAEVEADLRAAVASMNKHTHPVHSAPIFAEAKRDLRAVDFLQSRAGVVNVYTPKPPAARATRPNTLTDAMIENLGVGDVIEDIPSGQRWAVVAAPTAGHRRDMGSEWTVRTVNGPARTVRLGRMDLITLEDIRLHKATAPTMAPIPYPDSWNTPVTAPPAVCRCDSYTLTWLGHTAGCPEAKR